MLLVIGVAAGIAVFLAKGYRLSPKSGTIAGTGIISVTSVPDQASVYLDDHLTTATNDNINSLTPKSYKVKIVKDGYIPWEKQVEVREGLVTEIKATLFRSIPSIYPITYSGVTKAIISPDNQKIAFVVPESANATSGTTAKKSGVYVWQMSTGGLISGGSDPRQVALSAGLDWANGDFRWSPDSNQLMVTFPDRTLLLEIDRLNDPARDITATVQATKSSWDQQYKTAQNSRLQSIKDLTIRKAASEAAVLKFSPDETKILYCLKDCETGGQYKVTDLTTKKSYDMPAQPAGGPASQQSGPKASYYTWLPDSQKVGEHVILVETQEQPKTPLPSNKPSENFTDTNFPNSKISIVEFDGLNKSEIYAGNFNPQAVFPWPDGSRLLIVSSFPTATASQPNLFGVNLK